MKPGTMLALGFAFLSVSITALADGVSDSNNIEAIPAGSTLSLSFKKDFTLPANSDVNLNLSSYGTLQSCSIRPVSTSGADIVIKAGEPLRLIDSMAIDLTTFGGALKKGNTLVFQNTGSIASQNPPVTFSLACKSDGKKPVTLGDLKKALQDIVTLELNEPFGSAAESASASPAVVQGHVPNKRVPSNNIPAAADSAQEASESAK